MSLIILKVLQWYQTSLWSFLSVVFHWNSDKLCRDITEDYFISVSITVIACPMKDGWLNLVSGDPVPNACARTMFACVPPRPMTLIKVSQSHYASYLKGCSLFITSTTTKNGIIFSMTKFNPILIHDVISWFKLCCWLNLRKNRSNFFTLEPGRYRKPRVQVSTFYHWVLGYQGQLFVMCLA